MSSKEKKGHEREVFGYRISTSPADNGWGVRIAPRPKARGARGEVVPVHGIDRDGFEFEGQALDWAEDWALAHRVYTVRMVDGEHGAAAEVVDDGGAPLWRSVVCPDAIEARNLAEAFIRARQLHDQDVLKAREANRADYRLKLDDLRAAEDKARAAMEEGKAVIKECDAARTALREELRDPQVPFNFVAAIEREKVRELKGAKDPRQSDVEDYARGKKPPPRGAQT